MLAVFLSLAELATMLTNPHVRQILREGLVIIGWVAIWRPLEVLLYDWWPLSQKRRLLQRLFESRLSTFIGIAPRGRPRPDLPTVSIEIDVPAQGQGQGRVRASRIPQPLAVQRAVGKRAAGGHHHRSERHIARDAPSRATEADVARPVIRTVVPSFQRTLNQR